MKFQCFNFILHCCLLEQLLCGFVLIQKQNQSTAPDVSVNHYFLHPQCTFSDLYLTICNAYPFSLSVLSYPSCICSRWMLSLTRWAHRNRVSELVACADTSVQTSGIFTSAAVAHGHSHPLDVSLNSSTFIGGYEKAQITKCKHALPLYDALNALNVDIMKGRPRPRTRRAGELSAFAFSSHSVASTYCSKIVFESPILWLWGCIECHLLCIIWCGGSAERCCQSVFMANVVK